MRTDTEIRALERRDVEDAIASLNPQGVRRLLSELGVRVNPRFVHGGLASVVGAALRGVSRNSVKFTAHLLTVHLNQETVECLGDAYEDPTRSDLENLLEVLLSRHPPGIVRLFFAKTIDEDAKASQHLADLLDSYGPLAVTRTDGDDSTSATQEPDEREEDADAPTVEDSVELFTALDRLIIKTAVASHAGTIGAPTVDDFRVIIEELSALNSERRPTLFLQGFSRALDPAVPPPEHAAMNEDRWVWYYFGLFSGHARQGDTRALMKAHTDHPLVLAKIISDPKMGSSLTTPVVEAVLAHIGAEAASIVLAHRHTSFAGIEHTLENLYQHARRLAVSRDSTAAEQILTVLLRLAQEALPPHLVDIECARLRRRISMARRARGDFAGAHEVLSEVDLGRLNSMQRAAIEAETGLIEATIEVLPELRLPHETDRLDALAARLRQGSGHFETAVELDTSEHRARFCLGILAACDSEWETAVEHLELAEAVFSRDDLVSPSFLASVRFLRGLADLKTLRQGRSEPAYKAIERAIEAGFRPEDSELRDVLEHLLVYGSERVGEFLTRALEIAGSPGTLLPVIEDALRSGRHAAVPTALALSTDESLTATARYDLLAVSLDQTLESGDRSLAMQVVEAIDDLLDSSQDADLDNRWADALESDVQLRGAIGAQESDMELLQLWRQLGMIDKARAKATELFYRAAGKPSHSLDPTDLLEVVAHLGATDDELLRLRPLVEAGTPTDLEARALRVPILIQFVGGNETQARYREEIEQELLAQYEGRVQVTWHDGTWNSAWTKVSDRVEARYDRTDALVMLPMIRTNLGRRLRRTCGEAGIPWFACTAHGRDGVRRAIERAVRTVAARGTGS